MGREDWYRRTTWTKVDRDEFFDRLKRSRSTFHKSQYLRIQALTLFESGMPKESIELLDLLIAEYPDESQLASAYDQQGECLEALRRPTDAAESYRAAIRYEREHRSFGTCAANHFALLVAKNEMWQVIDEAVEYLDEYAADRGIMFPADCYAANASMAIFAWANGERTVARNFAEAALADSGATYSGLPRHPDIGLATPIPQIQMKLRQMVKSSDRKPWWKIWPSKGE